MIVSVGMSTMAQVDHAVEVLGTQDLIILHTTSAYPAKIADLNLRMIPVLRERYGVPVGYSGHEVGARDQLRRGGLGRRDGSSGTSRSIAPCGVRIKPPVSSRKA